MAILFVEDFSRKTTVRHPFGEYWPFPVEFCKKWQNMLKDGDDHWRPFIFPGKSPVVIHFSHQPSNMICRMMENMLRWWAGHGAATAGENSFLLLGPETYKLSGRVRSGRGDARLGPGNKSEGVAAKERREKGGAKIDYSVYKWEF